jgi:hypothetical protein
MTNERQEHTRAQICGMSVDKWRAIKEIASNARTRGRKSRAPRAPRIADDPQFPCAGQMGLFPESPKDGEAQ